MTGIEAHEWEQIRKQGRDRFVLREGVLKRGLRDAAVLIALWVIYHSFMHKAVPPLLDLWSSIAGFCIVALGAGWIEGVAVWDSREKEYAEYLKGNDVA